MSTSHCLTVRPKICHSSKIYRRPGILVLVNDADWELEGEERYEPKDADNILFISTLHGG